jgi:hypothetical protein
MLNKVVFQLFLMSYSEIRRAPSENPAVMRVTAPFLLRM